MTALARQSDPETSKAAARGVDRCGSEALVLEMLGLSPMTNDALEWLCRDKYSPSRIRTARCDLERAGLVVDTGRTEATARGNQAIVWMLATNSPAWAGRGEALAQAGGTK